jgi:putative membrane protein
MPLLFQLACAAAVLAHLLFFAEESLLWMRPAIHQRTFGFTLEQAQTMRLMAYNQGFYNLFLALGAGWGLVAPSLGQAASGQPVAVFALGSMLGAALVLLRSSPRLWLGAVVQGGPPLVALAALALAR